MIIRPRYTILAGLLFVVVGVVYGLLSHDPIGVTLLLALGVGMGLMSYVLIAGSPRGDEQ
jgi:VIT1/CCC1 family predicted Fe2+/Mn2+ transporter